jgi:D-glycero-D-manno-heptose 1,7-bisphosphate phosphatase
MIPIHGRPFLEYVIEMLKEQGFSRVLLLLGYLAPVVQDHFGDGRRFGVEITYSVTPPEDLTLRRMRAALDRLDDTFLLNYCDIYWPLQFERMWRRYEASGAPAQVTVYSNKDSYSRNTMRVGSDGYVELFDRTRTAAGLNGNEISYAILRRDLITPLPDEDVLLEEALYPRLAAQRQLLAYVTDHRYYNIGSAERIPLVEEFLARRPAVIVDRDGVLNRRPEVGQYVCSVSDFEWLPGSLEALRRFHEAGYRVIVASNQAGIARGRLSVETLEAIHGTMRAQAAAAGGCIDAVYYCPHDWNAGCECRKPQPGMLFRAQRDFSLDLTRTCFLGDDERDLQAAESADMRGRLVTPDEPLLTHAEYLLSRDHYGPRPVFSLPS